MRTVSIFNNGKNQAIRIPKDMEFKGVNELEISKEGDTLIIRPARPDWLSFAELDTADDDFLTEREDVVDLTAQIRQQLAKQGTPIGNNDTAIAGHALATQSIIITNNTREFSRVKGLHYEDWCH